MLFIEDDEQYTELSSAYKLVRLSKDYAMLYRSRRYQIKGVISSIDCVQTDQPTS